jgi:uncharacterized membrane protein YdbT with pleckstrin-like domain
LDDWPSEENLGPRINVNNQPELLMVLQMVSSMESGAVTTTVTSRVTSTQAAQTVTETVSMVDMTSVIGAGVVALIVVVVVGWLLASRKK